MTIKMLTSVAGTNFSYASGEILDAPEEIGRELVRAGHAELVAKPPVSAAEKATSKQAVAAEKR